MVVLTRASTWVVLLALAGAAGPAASGQNVSLEYKVKAVFLTRFAQFVEWPATAFADAKSPIVIGVLGEDPFGAALDEAIKDETPQGRALVLKRANQLDDLKSCHIIFMSQSEKARLPQLFKNLAGAAVFIVGETDQFARQGGVINFTTPAGKLQFEINDTGARARGLKINAQLLQLAKGVF